MNNRPIYLIPLISVVISGCHANFAPPKDFQSLTREDGTKSQPISEADQQWAIELLAQCEWIRPKHKSIEPRYRLRATQASGEDVVFNVRGSWVVVSMSTGAGRCKLKPADGQRLASIGT